MFVAERDIAAGPGSGYSATTNSLTKCWGDSALSRQQTAEGRFDSFAAPACMSPVDEDGIGLCADCRKDILG